MKQVIVFPRGQLSADDRAALVAADFVPIEADDPKAIIVHIPSASLVTPDDLFMSALAGVTNSTSEYMVAELRCRLKAKEAALATRKDS